MTRRAFLLLLLTACNFDQAASGDPKTAAQALEECAKVCPAGSTPLALSTIVSDTWYSTHWSCGCMGKR